MRFLLPPSLSFSFLSSSLPSFWKGLASLELKMLLQYPECWEHRRASLTIHSSTQPFVIHEWYRAQGLGHKKTQEMAANSVTIILQIIGCADLLRFKSDERFRLMWLVLQRITMLLYWFVFLLGDNWRSWWGGGSLTNYPVTFTRLLLTAGSQTR